MIPEKLHIVLAEDDQDDKHFFKNVFKSLKLNYTLTICEDGTQLINYLQHTDELPHIIFLDLKMPEKSGIECLEYIRSEKKFDSIAIAIYTNESNPQTYRETLIKGANIFIRKPDNYASLHRILTDVIYLNWQYITDGLNRENFIISY